MDTITTTTVTSTNGWDIADMINGLVSPDLDVQVQGQRVDTRWGKPATAYGTGSVSVKVPAKRGSGVNLIWLKPGAEATVTTTTRR